jgi:hypothetical protein
MIKYQMFRYNLARLIATIEVPLIYMLLSWQASDPFWKDVWFVIAMIKFSINAYVDWIQNKEREKHLKAMQDYIDNLKRKK